MHKFIYYVEGCGIEVSVIAATQKEAHKVAWDMLTDEQKNAAACLDWVGEEPA